MLQALVTQELLLKGERGAQSSASPPGEVWEPRCALCQEETRWERGPQAGVGVSTAARGAAGFSLWATKGAGVRREARGEGDGLRAPPRAVGPKVEATGCSQSQVEKRQPGRGSGPSVSKGLVYISSALQSSNCSAALYCTAGKKTYSHAFLRKRSFSY